jgi:hypothetical protein
MSDRDFLTAENRAHLEVRRGLRATYCLDPQAYKASLFPPCRVRILMVADDFIYISDEAFGQSDLISILNKPPGPYVRFELACAHRSPNVSDAQAVV